MPVLLVPLLDKQQTVHNRASKRKPVQNQDGGQSRFVPRPSDIHFRLLSSIQSIVGRGLRHLARNLFRTNCMLHAFTDLEQASLIMMANGLQKHSEENDLEEKGCFQFSEGPSLEQM